ncbi:Gfo/Idh/MocA family protein [Pseudoduganella namucuonensis]|uniref:Predicted dehydrogenase n=1 Tax=Pseudoduganella namucuonensis TaxID=1035707 RepID=A0A1I7L9P1_9BURK|nr:Gfo/Idh/MocA family oxidoreductase [Pseudoduganella namucuonensis]SFV06348.1 Predicted dehydrogenase [Pseudoduganella namucuonensis]
MGKVIRWGILGTGKIATAMAQGLRDTPDAELVAVASRTQEGAERFGAEFGVARRHGGYQALADDPDVDVIYIATPHPMHHENAIMCLNAGKALLVEKSFTVNRRQAEEIAALARAKKLFVMEAMWSRFMPAIVEAKRIVDSGEIGAPASVSADFGFASDAGPEHRLFNPELGGGSLLDLGIYPLSLSAYFLGPVREARAAGQLGATGVDVQASFSLKHEGGGLSSAVCSLRARTPCELTVSGSLGFVRLNTRFYLTESLTVQLADGTRRDLHVPRIGNGYAHEAIEVGRCLRAGLLESPVMPLDDTLALMGILDDMRAQIGVRYGADIQP